MFTTPVLTLLAMFSMGTLKPSPILELEHISEDSDVFLQLPLDVAIDDEGKFYVVDATAKTVFVWNKDGSFEGNIGEAGEGPGEFRFTSMGGPQAYLSIFKGDLLVYDGGNSSVNLFKDKVYTSSTTVKIPQGRTEYFKVTPEGEYLVYIQKWGEAPSRQVDVYDKKGQPIRPILTAPDETYTLKTGKDGGFGGLNLKAFSSRLMVHYDQSSGQVITGSGATPSFEVYDISGKLVRKVSVKLMQQEVTREDQEEYNSQTWISRGVKSGFLKIEFPEKKPFYTHLLPLKDKGTLVYTLSPHERRIQGLLVNDEGATLSTFKLTCGQGGNLFSVNGRIIAVMLDENDEFVIRELGFQEVGS